LQVTPQLEGGGAMVLRALALGCKSKTLDMKKHTFANINIDF
jgi:hypothetical protein